MPMTLSRPQRETVLHVRRPEFLCVSAGAIRSGKTHATALAFASYLGLREHPRDHVIAGVTASTAWRNQGRPVMDVLARWGQHPRLDRQFGMRLVAGGQSVWIIGGNDERARRRVQGMTLAGLAVDEAVLVPESFWHMLTSRCSLPESKVWATLNPESPAHWFRRQIIKRPDEWQARVIDYRLRDNPSLDASVIARYETQYTGHERLRMIEGQWAGASGLIYPDVAQDDGLPDKPVLAAVGVDWAASRNSFAALLGVFSVSGEGRIVAERIYSPPDRGAIPEIEQVQRTVAWARGARDEHAPDVPISGVVGDPTTPAAAKHEFIRQGMSWGNADNDVRDGISATASAFASGKLRVSPRCVNLLREIGEYQWDPKASEGGKDRPLKVQDDACDALRYLVMATIGRGG